ncbi:hypothetical protein FA13DRAFT_162268 [Coprinellus micaceus]|uniref:Nephrocystin 3-like N-terminal domain-containing protein n=1 Tax=Coprinellus micaceus TaxID=71717 RepID=A0A4Y7THF6_COPMI|nr:hypothetical protein FA13DRAFT_162268 [Coprinellus micaceus]
MFNNSSHLAVGDVIQVNARAYNRSGSSNVNVSDSGQYSNSVEVHAGVYQEIRGDDTTLKELYTHISPAARGDAPKCHPETRKAVQQNIFSWMSGGSKGAASKSTEDILWLTGPAGTGKTAIMGTVSDKLQKRQELAATFYFSSYKGIAETMSKRRLVTTLAYQLAVHPHLTDTLLSPILSTIRKNPALFDLNLTQQLETLILQPLRASRGNLGPTSTPMVILIDGVDECGEVGDMNANRSRQEDQIEVLSVLRQAINDPAFPFRVIVASRPETWIRRFFTDSATGKVTEIFLDNKYNPDNDIRLFLKSKFAELCRRYGLDPSTWPSEQAIAKLVEDASGQFIYVATVLRYIDTPGTSPHRRLDVVLKLKPQSKSNPFAVLDALYTSILQSSPGPEATVLWLKAVKYFREMSEFRHSAWTVNRLLESHVGQAKTLLGNLPSLVHTPDYEGGHLVDSRRYGEDVRVKVLPTAICGVGWSTCYAFYHKSFLDYLEDDSRCGAAFPGVDGHRVDERIQERLALTLKCGAPEVPVHSSLLLVFQRCFLDLLVGFYMSGLRRSIDEGILSECEPSNWLGVSGQIPSYKWHQGVTERTLYGVVHHSCRSYCPCNPGCKRWWRAISKLSNDRWRRAGTLPPWSSVDILLDRFNVKSLEV